MGTFEFEPAKPLYSPEEGRFTWYDGEWLSCYLRVRDWLCAHYPARVVEFEEMLQGFRTRLSFQPILRSDFISQQEHRLLQVLVRNLAESKLERHEHESFGRFILHDHPVVTEIQHGLVQKMSEWVQEEVEVSYNFISRYREIGVCPPHLDSPEAKWTLDICLDQSHEWPIYFGPVVPWPESFDYVYEQVSPALANGHASEKQFYQAVTMRPGQGVIFSGSSQWHCRQPIYRSGLESRSGAAFCDLVFFHFVPKGHTILIYPDYWAQIMGIPEIASVAGGFRPKPPRAAPRID